MNIQETLSQRQERYGDFSDNADTSQALKSIMRATRQWDSLPNAGKEALDNIQQKIARILNGDPLYEDSWFDIVGYAQLALKKVEKNNHLLPA